MFSVTKAAAEQIRTSAEQGNMGDLALRIAATKKPDGSLDYAMGFDEPGEEDIEVKTEGVKVVIAPQHVPLLKGAAMDYVELEAGTYSFMTDSKFPRYFSNSSKPLCVIR